MLPDESGIITNDAPDTQKKFTVNGNPMNSLMALNEQMCSCIPPTEQRAFQVERFTTSRASCRLGICQHLSLAIKNKLKTGTNFSFKLIGEKIEMEKDQG